VVRPVGGAVAGGLGLAHAARLTAWIRNVNPSWREFCNNAGSVSRRIRSPFQNAAMSHIHQSERTGSVPRMSGFEGFYL
ncbi:hypothetical protein, partial [Salipiger bermudensis]|uniref:hypothetical protein n=1 Tax=Salipiger bermudensis TaxID=344736 RepID=UPI001CD2F886